VILEKHITKASAMSPSDTMMIDAIGIPEFFVTEVGRIEEAGGECLRIYNCIRRAGQLVPLFTVVIPKDAVILAATKVITTAREAIESCVVVSH
jgi:hypothetical protein